MSTKLLNGSQSVLTIFTKRLVTIRSNFDLGNEMKLLNDAKQFKRALELFDKHKKNNVQTFSSLSITQALKACTHLEDLQHGEAIHHLISSRINNDSYISTSLIHLYSKF